MTSNQWVILEIKDSLDNPEYGQIENAILEIFGAKVDYFIPIHYQRIGSYTSTNVLLQGYAFVKDSDHVREMLGDVRDSRILSRALVSQGRVQTIDSNKIAVLKRQLKNSLRKKFAPGTLVKICDGPLKNLTGEVISTEDKGLNVMVKVNRLSREILAPVPATLIEKLA